MAFGLPAVRAGCKAEENCLEQVELHGSGFFSYVELG